MEVTYDRAFLKSAKKLPIQQQKLLAKKLLFLQSNPFDTRLHTKPLSSPLTGIYSFRITREYRILFRFIDPETIFLITAKHRKEVYQ